MTGGLAAAAFIVWCGACWVLRGGKFGAIYRALFRREPGTTVTRIGCAVLMATPLAFVDPAYALLAVSIWVAMTIGYFKESMGVKDRAEVVWMSLWGNVVLFIALLPLVRWDPSYVLHWSALGLLAGPIYYFNKPFGRRFGTDWTERAEFLTGCAFGAALFGAALAPPITEIKG